MQFVVSAVKWSDPSLPTGSFSEFAMSRARLGIMVLTIVMAYGFDVGRTRSQTIRTNDARAATVSDHRPRVAAKVKQRIPHARQVARGYPNRSRFGINLAAVTDWSREWAFVDVFRHSRPWLTHDLKEATREAGFDYDEHGNPLLKPGQMVQTIMLRDMDGHYPAGKYVATYQGTGRVSIRKFDVSQVVHGNSWTHRIRGEPCQRRHLFRGCRKQSG